MATFPHQSLAAINASIYVKTLKQIALKKQYIEGFISIFNAIGWVFD